MSELNFTLKILNNIKIAVDCTIIALKYSKCYMCRLPLLKGIILDKYLRSIEKDISEGQ